MGGIDVGKHGKTTNGKQRFICKESDCEEKTFIRDYSEKVACQKSSEKSLRWPETEAAFVSGPGIGYKYSDGN